MTTPAAVAAVEEGACNRSTGAAESEGRLFNSLEDESKERILRLLTAFQTLTLMEQEALLQEMNACLSREEKQSRHGGLGKFILKGPALRVQQRDRSYVALASSPAYEYTAVTNPSAAAVEEGEEKDKLTMLVKSQLSGQPLLSFPTTQSEDVATSVFTVPAQPPACSRKSESSNHSDKLPSSKGEETATTTESHADANDSAGYSQEQQQAPLLLYRSRGYHALRLARDDKHTVEDTYTRPSVLNLTGMPVDESDVWEWFECMDVAGDGAIGIVPFLTAINDLERDFGVSQRAKAEFVQEVEALATDGVLTFEKFAYLVSRFPRH